MSKSPGAGEAAELVELLPRFDTVAGRYLRHERVALTRNALQGDAEHLVHFGLTILAEPKKRNGWRDHTRGARAA